MRTFSRFELRTTDADAARAFYSSILGHDRAVIWPLHEEALARGARPHWLGFLDVDDVERASAAFVERGATPIGPIRRIADGGQASVLRDPGGAMLALATPPKSPPSLDVTWLALNTNDVTRATTNYSELFGWAFTTRIDLGAQGTFQEFAWTSGGASIGVFGDIAGRPGVHPHWLSLFEVDALEPAITAIRAKGGLALEPITLPSGERFCVCDDPQGAAFGLRVRR